jgi:hypothetical protein
VLSLEVEGKVLMQYRKILWELVKRFGLGQEKDFSILKQYRQTYAKVLTESNTEIVLQHCLGIEAMIRVV